MGSFVIASYLLQNALGTNLTWVNDLSRRRGPDHTNVAEHHGWTFLHNLLHMTGERRIQPFTSADAKVVAMFHGELYNWKELAEEAGEDWKSDGDALLPLYLKHGKEFLRDTRGDFAVVIADFRSNEVLVGTDPFMCKPIFVGTWKDAGGADRFGVSAYRSALIRLGADDSATGMTTPNSVTSFSMEPPFKQLWRHQVVQWDKRQYKTNTDDWIRAFEAAVRRRTVGTAHATFIGLSSGYDSGALMLALHRQKTPFLVYTVRASEDQRIVEDRVRYCKDTATTVRLGSGAIARELSWLEENCEGHNYTTALLSKKTGMPMWQDTASRSLSGIMRRARPQGALVHLSGTGADEIFHGPGCKPGSFCLKTEWPEQIGEFPWASFTRGQVRDYLLKEDLVAGAHGIEARYPFLDRDLAQEYLYLSREVKAAVFKKPLHDYMTAANFPFPKGTKVGFGLGDLNCTFVRTPRGGRRKVCTRPPDEELLNRGPDVPRAPALTAATRIQQERKATVPVSQPTPPPPLSPAPHSPSGPVPRAVAPLVSVPRTAVPLTRVPRTTVPLTPIPPTPVPRTPVPPTRAPQRSAPHVAVPFTPIPTPRPPRTPSPTHRTPAPPAPLIRTPVPVPESSPAPPLVRIPGRAARYPQRLQATPAPHPTVVVVYRDNPSNTLGLLIVGVLISYVALRRVQGR
eukprot:TRINITY_DN324_c0_g2_i4.p1 TRINITY_DN324_c0_g2~~TRINITY_DN324_c0_g2_i4.p1  ORF type:complete len:702 (+),score=74.55 TRINITY_DN324_c0_g2_i4:53-2107(+)